MTNTNLLSGRTIDLERSVCITFKDETRKLEVPAIPVDCFKEKEAGYDYWFYVVSTFEDNYTINTIDYERIISAIAEGSKFVKIEEDVVNVSQIKKFKKINASLVFYKYLPTESGSVEQVIDEERLKEFKKKLELA
jgi:hypothetical protein